MVLANDSTLTAGPSNSLARIGWRIHLKLAAMRTNREQRDRNYQQVVRPRRARCELGVNHLSRYRDDVSRGCASRNWARQRGLRSAFWPGFTLQKKLETRPKCRRIKNGSVQSVLATIRETDLAARSRISLSSAYSPGGCGSLAHS